MPEHRSHAPLIGLAAVAAACCALPLLAVGAAAAFGGVVLGSAALVGIGVALIAWGAKRRRERCVLPEEEKTPQEQS